MHYLIVDDHAAPKGHWVHPHIIPLSRYSFAITPVNPQPITDMGTFHCWPLPLILCDGVTFTPTPDDPTLPALPPVTLTEHFFYDAYGEAAYFPIPAVDQHASFWNLLRQTDDYCDEHDHYAEYALDHDETTLAAIVTMARHRNPTALLTSFLQSMPDEYKTLLTHHTFSFTIQSDQTITVHSPDGASTMQENT